MSTFFLSYLYLIASSLLSLPYLGYTLYLDIFLNCSTFRFIKHGRCSNPLNFIVRNQKASKLLPSKCRQLSLYSFILCYWKASFSRAWLGAPCTGPDSLPCSRPGPSPSPSPSPIDKLYGALVWFQHNLLSKLNSVVSFWRKESW